MHRKVLHELISSELEELHDLVVQLCKQRTTPTTRRPRPRIFHLAPNVTWPARSYDGGTDFLNITAEFSQQYCLAHASYAAQHLGEVVGWQPRKVIHMIQQIRLAKQWCRKRMEGREREAQEILKQQSRWWDKAEAELAVRILSKEVGPDAGD